MTGIKGDYADYFEEPLFERYLKVKWVTHICASWEKFQWSSQSFKLGCASTFE